MHFNFNGQNFDGAGFSDFFETLFGGRGSRFGGDPFGGFRQQQPRRGRDVEAELPLTLEEVARGGRRSVNLQTAFGPKTLEVNVPSGIREGASCVWADRASPLPAVRRRFVPAGALSAAFRVQGGRRQPAVRRGPGPVGSGPWAPGCPCPPWKGRWR